MIGMRGEQVRCPDGHANRSRRANFCGECGIGLRFCLVPEAGGCGQAVEEFDTRGAAERYVNEGLCQKCQNRAQVGVGEAIAAAHEGGVE